MKIINSKIHGIIDYVVVLFLWLSPTLFKLSPTIAAFTYALGGVHLILTLLTDFKLGAAKIIPLKLHGWIELVVGVILVASPLALQAYTNFADKYFFALFGTVVLLQWWLSDYDGK